MVDGNGANPETAKTASDDMKDREKLGLVYIYREGNENRFEVSVPVDDPMGKLFVIDLLNNVMKAILTAPLKKFKPKIIQPPGNFLNRLRNFKAKR